jgi:putative ATPase
VIARSTRSAFESLNAVLTGVKDVREAVERAEQRRKLHGQRTILFVDEVHRWNRAQQDALLPWVENGTVILIGATTENPFFEVNRALVSRSRIFQLKALTAEDLMETARRALADKERGYGRWDVRFEAGALEHLVQVAAGDARSLLNALELAVETTPPRWPPEEGAEIRVSFQAAEESIQKRAVLYDRDGDYHFDTISAFIKSLRGSDPDGALYWLAKMVRSGEDPSFIFRRMIILASEDVGLADPRAITVVTSCAEAFDRIGFPEGNFPLAQAALYLATAPKSNSALAFFDALKAVEAEDAEVPNHLRDPSRDKEGFGHGEGYQYPHAYREHWTAQQYLPWALRGRTFYTPSEIGYEGQLRQQILQRKELQTALLLQETAQDGELLSWSAQAKGREGWYKRLESNRSALLLADREALFQSTAIQRHHRILILGGDDGLLLWEALRRVPEGLAALTVGSGGAKETLEQLAETLDPVERPRIALIPPTRPSFPLPDRQEAAEFFQCDRFELLMARNPWRRGTAGLREFATFAQGARDLLVGGGAVSLLVNPPLYGQRISALLGDERGAETLSGELAELESDFFKPPLRDGRKAPEDNQGNERPWTWEGGDLETAFQREGYSVRTETLDRQEYRLLTKADLTPWFDPGRSPWAQALVQGLGEEKMNQLRVLLEQKAQRGPILWRWKSVRLYAVTV